MADTYLVEIDERKFRFGPKRTVGFTIRMETWMLLSDYTQLAPVDFGRMKQESFVLKTCYCATKLWHLEKGKKVNFDESTVEKWIENMSTKHSTELINTLFKSKIGGESLEELIPKALERSDEIKKKSHGMKSKTMQSV